MPFVDLESTTIAATASGIWDSHRADYLQPALQLLPPGRAWPRFGLLKTFLHGLTMEFWRVHRRAGNIVDELDVRTTVELLTDWERILGLPECSEPETFDGRRAAVVAKMIATQGHDQSLGFWQELAKSLGFEVVDVELGEGPFNVLSPATDSLGSEEWESVWSLIVEHGDEEAEALLQCYVDHNASLETLALTHFRWNLQTSGTVEHLEAIVSGGGYLLAVGRNGVVIYSADDGETWANAEFTSDDMFAAGYNAGNWMIGGVDGRIYSAVDTPDILSWNVIVAFGFEIYAIDGVAALAGHVHVGTEAGDPDIQRTIDGGGTWPAGIARPLARDVYHGTHDGTAWVQVGSSGAIFRSTNQGASWSSIASGTAQHLHGVDAWIGTMIAVGENGTILRSTNSGSSWTAVTSGTPKHLYGVAARDADHWYAVGQDGVIFESLNAGVDWTPAETQPTSSTLRACCVHKTRLIAVGDGGVIVTE
jgi:uncharacterized protein YmfQ (DUF2313 family)/photosystem II stability/assembly factor-like uncharacterized protein